MAVILLHKRDVSADVGQSASVVSLVGRILSAKDTFALLLVFMAALSVSCCSQPAHVEPKHPALKKIINTLDKPTLSGADIQQIDRYRDELANIKNFRNKDIIADLLFAYPNYITPVKKEIIVELLIGTGSQEAVKLFEADETMEDELKRGRIAQISQLNYYYDKVFEYSSLSEQINASINLLLSFNVVHLSTVNLAVQIMRRDKAASFDVISKLLDDAGSERKDLLKKLSNELRDGK